MQIRIAVSGSAGTGKSTLAMALAERFELPYLEEGFRKRREAGLDLQLAFGVPALFDDTGFCEGFGLMVGDGVHYRSWTPSGFSDVEEATHSSAVGRRRKDPDCRADAGTRCFGFASCPSLRRECEFGFQMAA